VTKLTSAERASLFRFRKKHRIHRRTVGITDDQLDALEVQGYLDPGLRAAGSDEALALEEWLSDKLVK
jgi:hypothetical protein